MAYSSPFEGESSVSAAAVEDVSAAMVGAGSDSDPFTITSEAATSAVSPLEARIEASNWSREDVELMFEILSVAATLAALYATYRGGR